MGAKNILKANHRADQRLLISVISSSFRGKPSQATRIMPRQSRRNDDAHRDVPTEIAAHAAAAISSKDTPVNVAEASHSMAEEAKSFACGMIRAGAGGPFNS